MATQLTNLPPELQKPPYVSNYQKYQNILAMGQAPAKVPPATIPPAAAPTTASALTGGGTPQYQHGGWYTNPATGKVQRWWNGAFLPEGQTDPLPTASISGGTSSGPTDYFTQAMNLLQPGINAQTDILKQQQDITSKQFAQSKQAMSGQEKAALGSQRAAAAASGITSTSGVEQSQEANIAQDWAQKQTIVDTQEASALIDIASKIAQIQGQGTKDAMNYAADLAKMASDQLWKQANYDLDVKKLDEATRYHNLSISLRETGAGTQAGKEEQYTNQAKADVASKKYSFPQILAMYSGKLTPDQLGVLWNTVQTGLGSQGFGPYQETPSQLGLEASALKSTQPPAGPGPGYSASRAQELTQKILSGEISSLDQAKIQYPDLSVPSASGQVAIDNIWTNAHNQRMQATGDTGGRISEWFGSLPQNLMKLLNTK